MIPVENFSSGQSLNTCTDHVNRENRVIEEEPVLCPFQIAVDTREQAPWNFTGLRADSRKKYRPLVVMTERKTLRSGDYSLCGLEDQISIERKSLADAFATFTVDRERFERELERLQGMRHAEVVIESGLDAVMGGPKRIDKSERQNEVIGHTVYCSIIAWTQRFPRVHWWFLPDRQAAERHCFKTLERFWNDWKEAQKLKRIDI